MGFSCVTHIFYFLAVTQTTTTKTLLVKTDREERPGNLLLESSAVKLDAGSLNQSVMIITLIFLVILLVILCVFVVVTPNTDGKEEPYVDHSTSSDDHVTGMVAIVSGKPQLDGFQSTKSISKMVIIKPLEETHKIRKSFKLNATPCGAWEEPEEIADVLAVHGDPFLAPPSVPVMVT